jgi:hypothetical protein
MTVTTKVNNMTEEQTGDPRGAINALELVKALQKHALGEAKMSATQVSAAIALLKKTLPDLPGAAVKLPPDEEQQRAHEAALKDLG